MVKNTKAWISWERNIIFLRNKKILNLFLRGHVLRSYRFVAEVTFKKFWNPWLETRLFSVKHLNILSKSGFSYLYYVKNKRCKVILQPLWSWHKGAVSYYLVALNNKLVRTANPDFIAIGFANMETFGVNTDVLVYVRFNTIHSDMWTWMDAGRLCISLKN